MSAQAEIRPAATLIVIDTSDSAPRVLMGHRRATARFMPGAAVFPGGAVDEADFNAPVASPLAPLTRAQLCRAASPDLADALAAAAARELHEETGLSLGHPPGLAGLRYLCRAVTPPELKIRFDARFLLVDAAELAQGGSQAELLQDGELERLMWYRLDEADTLALSLPTIGALGFLRQYLAQPARQATLAPLPVLLNGAAWEFE
jgi:8-oxo-dGTP pyrophosphatase MutT (NUDIX family)